MQIGDLLNYLKTKSELIKNLGEVYDENDRLENESYEWENKAKYHRDMFNKASEHLYSTNKRLEAKQVEFTTLALEARKLSHLVTEVMTNTHIIPAGELEECINKIASITEKYYLEE